MYSEKVMDHFEHPRNVGEIENASGVGTVGNAKCGDIMRIYLDIDDDQIKMCIRDRFRAIRLPILTPSPRRLPWKRFRDLRMQWRL